MDGDGGAGERAGERLLAGGWQTGVSERDGIVYRTPKPQSATVLALLTHLHEVGFAAAPRPVGTGFAPDGREQLTYVDGASPQPAAWSDEAVWAIGHLVAQLHEAAASFVPPPGAVWQDGFWRRLGGAHPVLGHGDLGPWNVLARDGVPVAFIDWDTAGPTDARWDLAQVAWLNAQLHDDDVAELAGLPPAADRARQLGLLVDGYGLSAAERVGFVDTLVGYAVHSARDVAVRHAVTEATPAQAANGFPVQWAITWQTRAAAWMLDHRALLEAALARPG